MRKLKGFGVVLVFISLIACTKDPRNIRITEDNKDTFFEEIKNSKGLTIDESRLLIAYLMRSKLTAAFGQNPPSPAGKTVGDLINDQRSFEADAKKQQDEQVRLASEAKAKEDALAAELRKAISLTVFQKDFVESNADVGRYRDYIVIKCAYKNSSAKDIRAFTGTIRFTDLFDKPVFESGVTISKSIKSGAKTNWEGSIEYNQFVDSHKALRHADLKDLKVVWIPKSILFADGSKMGGSEE